MSMIKTTLYMSPDQVEKIDMLALAHDLSREEIINQAITSFLKNQPKEPNSDPLEKDLKAALIRKDLDKKGIFLFIPLALWMIVCCILGLGAIIKGL